MQYYSCSPKEMFLSLLCHRHLLLSMVKREIAARYRGSVLGFFWSFVTPLLMLAVYTFAFSIVFKARWGTSSDSRVEFALVLFAGLLVYNVFAECINRAPNLILSNVAYVKKVVFPLEILPLVSLGGALFQMIVSLCVWCVAYYVMFGIPPVTIFLLPIVLLPYLLLIIGLSWGLASLGTYLRDIGQLIGIITTMLLFLSPIFYPITALPEKYRQMLNMNPLSYILEWARGVLIWGQMPDWTMVLIFSVVSVFIAWLGFAWFQKTRKGFADVL